MLLLTCDASKTDRAALARPWSQLNPDLAARFGPFGHTFDTSTHRRWPLQKPQVAVPERLTSDSLRSSLPSEPRSACADAFFFVPGLTAAWPSST